MSDDDYQYVYDASGTRIVRDGPDGTTVYLPGGQELTINGTTVSATRYYTFGGRTVATRTSNGLGGVTSLVSDRDGSVVAAVPNTTWTAGSLKRVYSDPFGAVRGNTDAGVPGDHRFLGAPRDAASGLTLLGARYYDPGLGCFISVDPVLNLTVPAHLHAYAYGFNNPVSFSDASGLEPRDRNGNYDGNYYGGIRNGSKSAGGPAVPPSTSWAALNACADVWCVSGWGGQAGVQFMGGLFEGIGMVLWEACTNCQVVVEVWSMVSDHDAYWAQKQADAVGLVNLVNGPDPVGTVWNGFWQPIGEDWANNPGHALGGAMGTLQGTVGLAAIPGGAAQKVVSLGGKAETAARSTLYHYTNEAGMDGILSEKKLNPSLGSSNPTDARYGDGQYLSDIAPGTMTCAQLSRCFLGIPFQGQRFTNYVEVDVTGLEVLQGRQGVFVVPGSSPLDLQGRIVGSGVN